MSKDTRAFLLSGLVVLIVGGGLLAWRLGYVPQIGKFFAAELAAPNDPQYIFVRKDNTCQNCFLWNGNQPENYSTAAFNEISSIIGTKGTPARRLGVGALFTPNLVDAGRTKQSLVNLLQASVANDFPVYLSFDDFNWWDARPDLWYWWEPGISPAVKAARKANVEWTAWDGDANDDHVVKIGWRNWGGELRVKPHPNLLSPAYIQNSLDHENQLLPVVIDWYNALPADKKYLLGGVDFGNEVDIGANYYYYPNGNFYLDKDPADDPNSPDFLADSAQVGYAALKAGNIKSSGTITAEDLNEAVNRYLNTLTKHAYDMGMPRNKIFNHTGGGGASPFNYPAYPVFTDLRSSVMPYAYPGWSFYGTVPANPQLSTVLNGALDSIGNTQWAVPEWLPKVSDYDSWLTAIRNSLNYRNNTLINVANWEQIRERPYVLDAIRTALGESVACRVTNPIVNSTIGAGSVTLSWSGGAHDDVQYLNITTDPALRTDSIFQTANITNTSVTGKSSFTASDLPVGKYYWLLASDGCAPVQRRVAYGSFTVTTAAVATVAPTATAEPTATVAPASTVAPVQPGSQEVWFSSNLDTPDLLGMFQHPEQWEQARAKIGVFKFYEHWNLHQSCVDEAGESSCPTTDTLSNLVAAGAFSKLHDWNIDIAIEASIHKPWTCSNPSMASAVAATNTIDAINNIQTHGGVVKYVAMDTAAYEGKVWCGFTQMQAAASVRDFIQKVRAVYPAVIIGDIEPYPALTGDALKSWVVELERVGVSLAFLHIDGDYSRLQQLQSNIAADFTDIKNYAHAHGMLFGVIINGFNTQSDQGFHDSAMDWVSKVAPAKADHIIYQTYWKRDSSGKHDIPANLPESAASSFTRLINDSWARLVSGVSATVAATAPPTTAPATTSAATVPPTSSDRKPGDVDSDGDVDIFDYNTLVSNFGTTNGRPGDLNGDGKVDIFDYNILVSNFGK